MWLLLAASALALDLDITVHPPTGAPVDVTFHQVDPGPVPGMLVAGWFGGQACRLTFDLREKQGGGFALGLEIAELKVLEDGTSVAAVAKKTTLKLADDHRTVLKLDGGTESWSIEVNSAPSPAKKAAAAPSESGE